MKYVNKYSGAAGAALSVASVVVISLFIAPNAPDETPTAVNSSEVVATTSVADPQPIEAAAQDEDSGRVTQSYVYAPSLFSDTSTGRQLKAFFFALDEFGDDAAKNYELVLQKIKADPKAARELISAYRRLNGEPSEKHYKILYTLGELKAQEALPLLIEVATSEIPARSATAEVEHGSDEGTLIRMRAIGGLRNLAADGSSAARDTLLRVVQESPDLTLRGEAVINYLAISKNVDRDIEFLKAMLPTEQHYLVTTQVRLPTVPNFQTTSIEQEH